MNPKNPLNNWLRAHRAHLVTAATALLLVLPIGAQASGVVTNCTEGALRAAMAGGGTVTFACDGTITLASTITNTQDTVLEASGRQVTLSGDSAVRVFWVGAGATLTLVNLTIANGGGDSGAGILNSGGNVNATNCAFLGNTASSWGTRGGAIFIKGTAKDNTRLAGVWCQTNGVWVLATTSNGWTNWTVDVVLVPGINVVRACAQDSVSASSRRAAREKIVQTIETIRGDRRSQVS